MTQAQKDEVLINLANLTEKLEEANKIIQYVGEKIQQEVVSAGYSPTAQTPQVRPLSPSETASALIDE